MMGDAGSGDEGSGTKVGATKAGAITASCWVPGGSGRDEGVRHNGHYSGRVHKALGGRDEARVDGQLQARIL